MLRALQLIPALRIIFSSDLEFAEDSFVELTAEQFEAYQRKVGASDECIYQVVQMEPTVINRQGRSTITLELNVVSESEKKDLLDAVKFIYLSSREFKKMNATFADRLDYLRSRFPVEIVGEKYGDRLGNESETPPRP